MSSEERLIGMTSSGILECCSLYNKTYEQHSKHTYTVALPEIERRAQFCIAVFIKESIQVIQCEMFQFLSLLLR